MDAAHDLSADHELGRGGHEGPLLAAETANDDTPSFLANTSTAAAAASSSLSSSSTPYVSLFSPHVSTTPPTIMPDFGAGPSMVHEETYATLTASRSMASLDNMASMTKRTSRLKVSDEQLPIVQLQTRIEQAQKSADDPTTPLETQGRRRTTMDLMRTEHSVRTDISRLFSESVAGAGSRAPSYSNATGPLYLRGTPSALTWTTKCVNDALMQR